MVTVSESLGTNLNHEVCLVWINNLQLCQHIITKQRTEALTTSVLFLELISLGRVAVDGIESK